MKCLFKKHCWQAGFYCKREKKKSHLPAMSFCDCTLNCECEHLTVARVPFSSVAMHRSLHHPRPANWESRKGQTQKKRSVEVFCSSREATFRWGHHWRGSYGKPSIICKQLRMHACTLWHQQWSLIQFNDLSCILIYMREKNYYILKHKHNFHNGEILL